MDYPSACAFTGKPVQDSRVQSAFKKPPPKTPSPDLAEKYHAAIDHGTRSYLDGRGITEETIKRFRLGSYSNNGTEWLTIPHFAGGKLANIKFRALPPAKKEFKRMTGCKSVLFNQDALKGAEEVFICEGELDGLTLLQTGLDNVVSGTTGAGSFAPEWIDALRHLKKIYLCYDGDEAGQKGARSLAKRLGYNRCYNVDLPEGQDVNDYFQDHGLSDFQSLVREARTFDLPGVVSFTTALDLLRADRERRTDDTGLLTPWENVNRLVRGFHPGDLIIVSAPPKTGKTTFCLEIARTLANRDEIPVLFYCLEMRPERLVQKIVQAQYQKESITTEDVDRMARELGDRGMPLYFAHSFRKEKLENVLSLIREAIQRYDLKLVIFDNLHFLVRSVSNVNEEVGQAVQGFKLLAEEMEIPIITIAQPRKRESGARDEIMRAEDIKYSNAVHADCDMMLILYRKRIVSEAKDVESVSFQEASEALSPKTLVRAEAHRYGPGGEAVLRFYGGQSRFEEHTLSNKMKHEI
jgi:archaellum biogenesis ATPase FlaH